MITAVPSPRFDLIDRQWARDAPHRCSSSCTMTLHESKPRGIVMRRAPHLNFDPPIGGCNAVCICLNLFDFSFPKPKHILSSADCIVFRVRLDVVFTSFSFHSQEAVSRLQVEHQLTRSISHEAIPTNSRHLDQKFLTLKPD